MPFIEVRVRKEPTHLPPQDIHDSRVWHACCLFCFTERNPRRGKPKHRVEQEAACCFCKTTMTTYRIRLAGSTFHACWHNRGARR